MMGRSMVFSVAVSVIAIASADAQVTPNSPAPSASSQQAASPDPASAPPAGNAQAAPTATAPDQVPSAAPAGAQPSGAADSSIGDIIVTATRTSSLASRTPISMQVYSSEAIASKGITSVQALANADTSLNINAGGGQPFIALRGVSTSDTSEVGDPAVPVSIDNLFTNRSYALNTSLFDIDRIEVLRGPQGTLFGRNAVGGIVNIYTNDPAKTLGGYGQIELGDYGTVNSTGALNVPLSETLQVRASFATNHHDGYRTIGAAGKGDDADNKSGRIKVAWEPIDRLHLNFEYQHVDVDETGITEELIPYQLNANGSLNRNVAYQGDGKSFPLQYRPVQKLKDDTLHWGAVYDFENGMALSYLGGYDNLRRLRVTQQSGTPPQVTKFSNAGFVQNEGARTLNQEVRLASTPNGAFTWQIGAFYFNEDGRVDTNLYFNYLQPNQIGFLRFNYPNVNARSIAGYGQASYALTSTLKVTGGIRYTDDRKEKVGGTDTLNLQAFGIPIPPIVSPSSGYSHSGVFTYHAGLDWQATPGSLIYAHADKGYKAGGYNSGDAVAYRPEILYAYEIGTKNRLFDNQLTLNLAAFYQDYKNQQAFTSVDPVVYGTTSIVENIGKSHIYGLEFSAVEALSHDTRIDFSGTLLHARFVDYPTIDRVTNTPLQLRGNTLPNSPNASLGGGIEHSFALFDGKLTPRIETKYQSVKYFTALNTIDGRQNGYAIGNLSIRYDDGRGRFTVEGYIRNFTDKTVLVDFNEDNDSNLYQYGFSPPRTIGGRVRVNF